MLEGINLETLDKETLDRLGITLPPSLGEVGGNLVVLGRVFNALKGLTDDDALQVLQHAQMYLINRKNALDIESVSLSRDEVQESYAPPIDWTLQVVAKIFKVKPADLKQRKRDAIVVQARQVAMYVLTMTNKYSFTYIGQSIGGRSPATVSHGFTRISLQVKENRELNKKVNEIQKISSGKV